MEEGPVHSHFPFVNGPCMFPFPACSSERCLLSEHYRVNKCPFQIKPGGWWCTPACSPAARHSMPRAVGGLRWKVSVHWFLACCRHTQSARPCQEHDLADARACLCPELLAIASLSNEGSWGAPHVPWEWESLLGARYWKTSNEHFFLCSVVGSLLTSPTTCYLLD